MGAVAFETKKGCSVLNSIFKIPVAQGQVGAQQSMENFFG
jgi:hypothetical protein